MTERQPNPKQQTPGAQKGATVVLLLGAPGAGKGTQAKRLAGRLALPHISTGDLFRENLGRSTPLGLKAKGFMEKGELVPDGLVIEMLESRVAQPDCAGGYLLDGFPRTLPQAEALGVSLAAAGRRSGKAPLLVVVDIAVPDALIVRRASGRLVCGGCGHIQHTEFDPPRVAGRCDRCGAALQSRADDQPAVVTKRLEVYHRQTAPLVQHYRGAGQLETIDGQGTPEEVFERLLGALAKRGVPGGRA
jgi:adenylate kinase